MGPGPGRAHVLSEEGCRAHVRYMHVRTFMICVYVGMDMCIYTPFVRLVSLVSPFKSPPVPGALPPIPLNFYYEYTTILLRFTTKLQS